MIPQPWLELLHLGSKVALRNPTALCNTTKPALMHFNEASRTGLSAPVGCEWLPGGQTPPEQSQRLQMPAQC